MVTVAIPTHNGEKYLESAFESIINQTHKAHQIVFCDDASDDNTKKIIFDLKRRFTEYSIDYFLNDRNLGYARNWTKCFEHCKTKYLIILHQDDLLKRDCIEKQLRFISAHSEIALVGGSEDKIDNRGELILKRTHNDISKIYLKGQILEFIKSEGSYIPCSSVCYNVEKIKEVGFFDTKYLASDELFWPRVLNTYPIAVLGDSLIYRRMHKDQAANFDLINKYDLIIVAARAQYQIADYEIDPERRNATLRLLRIKFSLNCFHIALLLFKRKKNVRIAFRYLKESITEYPQIIFTKTFIKYSLKAISQ